MNNFNLSECTNNNIGFSFYHTIISGKNTKSDEIIYSEKDVKNYIQFINDNITQDLTLEMIANHFYISKQYLCKIFKQKTGLTVKKYISYKRIVLVRELYSSGMSITEACTRAGFNGYSNFYRTFFNLMHESPRQNLSNIHFHFENTNSDNNSEFFSNQSEWKCCSLSEIYFLTKKGLLQKSLQ